MSLITNRKAHNITGTQINWQETLMRNLWLLNLGSKKVIDWFTWLQT